MRLGLPRLNSLSKFFLEILPAVVAIAVVGYLLSYVQADRADVRLPPDEIIQSARASELEEARSDRAMMLDVIRNRRISEEQAAERAREAKVAAENAPAVAAPSAEATPPGAVAAKEPAPLPPVRRVAAATRSESSPRSEPATRSEVRNKPKPAAEPKVAAAPLSIAPAATPPLAAPPEESRGPVMFVVDKAGELGRKAAATTGEAVAWVVSMPASLMSVKNKIFGDNPSPQQNGHILKGS